MFSPLDLHFVLCSLDLDILRMQQSIAFYLSWLPPNQQGWKIRLHGVKIASVWLQILVITFHSNLRDSKPETFEGQMH